MALRCMKWLDDHKFFFFFFKVRGLGGIPGTGAHWHRNETEDMEYCNLFGTSQKQFFYSVKIKKLFKN